MMIYPDLLGSVIRLSRFVVDDLTTAWLVVSEKLIFLSFEPLSLFFLPSPPPLRKIFSNPSVGASMSRERPAAQIVDQKISEITVTIPENGSQYKSILLEYVPPIITIR